MEMGIGMGIEQNNWTGKFIYIYAIFCTVLLEIDIEIDGKVFQV